MEQSVKSNSFEKFKVIASLPIPHSCFRFFKKDFLENPNKPGHENLVQLTSTVPVELSKLNFNFDDIRTFFRF